MAYLLRPFFGVALLPLVVATSTALAESLEDRVSTLEKTQKQQDEALQIVSDLVKKVQVSGFLSVRGGRIDSKEMTYLSVLDDQWSFSEETVAGLQVDVAMSDKLSASLQFRASGLSDGAELEWAYAEYAFAPDLKARAGRLRAPGYMLSEYLDVGYAYPWVQVPQEVYGWLPFNRYEGLDLRYWMSLGDVDLRLTTFAGTSSDQRLRLGNFEYADQKTRFAGVDVQATYDIFTFRAGYSKFRFDLSNAVLDAFLEPAVFGMTLVPGMAGYIDEVTFPGLTDYVEDVMVGDFATAGSGVLTDVMLAIQNDGVPENDAAIPILQAEGASLLSQLQPYQQIPPMNGNMDGEFYGLGFSADNGEFLLMSELSMSRLEGVAPNLEAGYIMLGYRIGNWMPHFTFAKMYTVDDDVFPDVQTFQGNPLLEQMLPGYAQLIEGANLYGTGIVIIREAMRVDQESYTLGLRWDPMPGLDLKAEVFMADMKRTSFGFALPKNMLALMESDIMDIALDDVSFPKPESNIVGMRVGLDLVF